MKKPKVVILGGGYAGLMAASRLARQRVADIVLLDRSPHFEQRIRYHQVLAGAHIPSGSLAHWLQPAGVGFAHTEVTALAPEKRRLYTSAGPMDYDFLIVTTGSGIDRGRIAGAHEHSYSLDSQAQCQTLAGTLQALAQTGGRLLLVGAGLTQLETSTELAQRYPGLQITVLCSTHPFNAFAPSAERYFRDYLQRARITLLEGHTVLEVGQGVCHTSQGALPFDVCLSAPGFKASPLITHLSNHLDEHGRANVTDTLQLVGDDRIWVAGDSAAFPWQGSRPLRMGCAVALPMGAQAGENVVAAINGDTPKPFSFGFLIRCVSLGRNAGVVQTTQWNDQAKHRVFTGATGAWIKERVCRMTFNVPRWELATGMRLYHWPSVPREHRAFQQAAIDPVEGP